LPKIPDVVCFKVLIQALAWRYSGRNKKNFRIVVVPAGIRNSHLPNTCKKRYSFNNLHDIYNYSSGRNEHTVWYSVFSKGLQAELCVITLAFIAYKQGAASWYVLISYSFTYELKTPLVSQLRKIGGSEERCAFYLLGTQDSIKSSDNVILDSTENRRRCWKLQLSLLCWIHDI
jgi:hypothetical protein